MACFWPQNGHFRLFLTYFSEKCSSFVTSSFCNIPHSCTDKKYALSLRQFFGNDGAGGSNSSSLNLSIAELFTASSQSYYHIIFFYLTHPAVYRLKTITAMTNVVKTTKRVAFTLLSSAALLSPLTITSCQDYEPFDEAEVQSTLFDRHYNEAFVQSFGEIDPCHNWGFGAMPTCGVDATRGANTNYNQWESEFHLQVPGGVYANDAAPWGWVAGDITQYERAYVYWWFSTHRNPESLHVNWSDYFIQSVWGQPEHSALYADGSNFLITDDYGIDHVLTDETNAGVGDWAHIYNFNAAGGSKEQVQRMENSATVDFSYNVSNSSQYLQNWTLQCINGNYYLAFDYQSHKCSSPATCAGEGDCVNLDGYYNDWILKLTPGFQKEDAHTRRVMCEDLGNTFDWDFNDVVFDVTFLNADYSNGRATAKITLQAAGGTIPVRVGVNDEAHEVHRLFNVATNVPVNVNAAGGVKRAAVIFQYEFQAKKNSYNNYEFNAVDVPIYVPSRTGADASLIGNTGANFFELTAEAGKAPQKFGCPNSTKWTQEFKKITEAYGEFESWVRNGAIGDSWTQTVSDASLLYVDPSSTSQAASSIPNINWPLGTIEPWKQIWLNRNDSKYWNGSSEASNAYSVFTTTEGRKNGMSFSSQAPYIFYKSTDNPNVYASTDADLIVISPRVMSAVLDNAQYNPYLGSTMIKDWYDIAGSSEAIVAKYAVNLGTNNWQYGSASTSDGKNTYLEGADVTISATPNNYYKFIKWSDENTENPRTITNIHENVNLQAIFGIDETVFEATSYTVESLNGRLPDEGATMWIHIVGNSQQYYIAWDNGQYQNYLENNWTLDFIIDNVKSINQITGVKSYEIKLKNETQLN